MTFIKFPIFILLHSMLLNLLFLYIFVFVLLVSKSFLYLFNSSIKSIISPIPNTIKKGIKALATDLVDIILIHEIIDVIKNIIDKRLFIL